MLQQCSSLLAWRLDTPFRARTRPGLWGTDIVRRFFTTFYIKRKSASADSPGTPFFSALPRHLPMPMANPVHLWSEERKLVEKLRPDRQNQSAHLDPRPPGVAYRRCCPSRRDGRHVDGFLLAGQVKLVEMTGPRKRGSQLTFSAACAQPQRRRGVLPCRSSCRATWSGHPRSERGTADLVVRPLHCKEGLVR